MRGRVKKLLSTALALLFLLALLPGSILAADVVASGDCGAYGSNVTWTLDGSGLLTISGTGPMANYSNEEHNQPWGGMLGIIKSLKINPGVTEIGWCAFEDCTALESISLPDTLTRIGWSAFWNCSALREVEIPASVELIENDAFTYCSGVENYYVGNGNPHYYATEGVGVLYAVNGNEHTLLYYPSGNSNKGIKLGTKTTELWSFAFAYAVNLRHITIRPGVTLLPYACFWGCQALENINIPATVTEIAAYTFGACNALTDVYFMGTAAQWQAMTIGDYNEPLLNAAVHCIDDVNAIPDTGLTWTMNGSGTLTVGGTGEIPGYDYSFYGVPPWEEVKSSIKKVVLGSGVTAVGEDAFWDCENLESVTLPNGLLRIGQWAFEDCPKLASVRIPATVTEIGYGAFQECDSLNSVTVDAGNPVYHSVGNCIVETAAKKLILGSRNGVIPADGSVTSIGQWAYNQCAGLQSITIPNTVTDIGHGAFYGCPDLTAVVIPESVQSIGNYAFQDCDKLKNVTIGSGVQSIGSCAFDGCGSLTKVTFIGTRAEWDAIEIGEYNDPLLNAQLVLQAPPPAAPTVTASYASGKVTVKWNAVEGATKYTVYRRAYSGSWSAWEAVKTNLTGTSWSDSGVVEGTEYQYRMRAYNGSWSGYSAAVNVKVIPKPAAPAMTASYASGKVSVTWNAVSGATKYTVYRRAYSGSWGDWEAVKTNLTGTSWSDTGITAGTEYQYRMRAYNGIWSDYSAAVNVKTAMPKPAAPAVTASYASGKVTVNWNAVSGASKYALYRRAYTGSWSSWETVSTSLTGTSYADGTVTPGTTYQYRMKAYNGTWSDYGAAAEVNVVNKPAAPTFTVSYEDGAMNVAWTAVSGAKKYALYRSCYRNGAWTSWTTVGTQLTGTSYTDPGVEEGYRYQYRMKAYNGLWSDYTPVVNVYSVSVPPAAPVISASVGSGKIIVTWGSVEGGIKYAVYRAAYEDGKWGKWTALSTTIKGANTSYEDKTAQAGVKYQYRMKAFNGLLSVYSNTVTVTG